MYKIYAKKYMTIPAKFKSTEKRMGRREEREGREEAERGGRLFVKIIS